jgi:hypothetical protein
VSLSNDGDTVAIGAPNARTQKGRVRVYRHDGDDWVQLGSNIRLESTDAYSEVLRNNRSRFELRVLRCVGRIGGVVG